MQIRCVREVGRSRLRELEQKRLRLVLNAQVVVHRPQVAVEAASEGAHGQVDAVRRCVRGIGNGD